MAKDFLNICKRIASVRHLSNKSAIITKPHRLTYARMYPTVVVQPDGSSFTIRHHEPRKIIQLPLDVSSLSESDKKERLDRRKPKKKVIIQEDIEDNFDSKKYMKFLKKKT